jgi:hypothetical protein
MEFRSNPPLFLLQLSRVAEPIRFYRDIHVQKGSIPLVFSYYTRLDGCPGGDSVHGVELFSRSCAKSWLPARRLHELLRECGGKVGRLTDADICRLYGRKLEYRGRAGNKEALRLVFECAAGSSGQQYFKLYFKCSCPAGSPGMIEKSGGI